MAPKPAYGLPVRGHVVRVIHALVSPTESLVKRDTALVDTFFREDILISVMLLPVRVQC